MTGLLPSGLVLSGCSDESSNGTSAQRANKPVAVVREYQSAISGEDFQVLANTPLHATVRGAAVVPDRFRRGDFCYAYDGRGAYAKTDPVPTFPAADFALSFWFLSSARAGMEALLLSSVAGPFMSIEFNRDETGVVVKYGGDPRQSVHAASFGRYTNGIWHHLHVQLRDQSLQLFLDGAYQGSVECTNESRNNISLRIGGSEIGMGWVGAIDDVRIHTHSFEMADVPRMVYEWTLTRPRINADAMAAYYRCDKFQSVAANDTGRSPDAATYDVTPARDRFDMTARAYSFDGRISYMQLSSGIDPVLTDFAVAFWVRTTSSDRMVAFSSPAGENASLYVALNEGAAVAVRVAGGSIAALSSGRPGAFADGRWHFLIVQRSGSQLQLFVDGTLLAATVCEVPLFGNDSRAFVGRSYDDDLLGHGYWRGAIDDVQIYIRSFGAEEAWALSSLAFWPRDGAGALSFRGRMWLLGGWNPSHPAATNSEVWSSLDGTLWTLATEAPWEGRHTAGYAVLHDRMWVVGGDFNRGHYQNDVWCSTDGMNWTQIADKVPWQNRIGQHVVAFADRLWLLGGEQFGDAQETSTLLNDVYSSADGIDWRLETSNAPWAGRSLILGSAVFRGRIWVVGGGSYVTRTFANDVWSSTDGVTWEQLTEQAPWSARQFHSIAVYHDKLWVVAGIDHDNIAGLSDVWYLDDGARWVQLTGTPWEPRHAASVVVHDEQMWLAAGGGTSLFNDVWRLSYAL